MGIQKNISKIVDDCFQFRIRNPEMTKTEFDQYVCGLVLDELKKMSAEELLPFFRSMDLKKSERQVVITLSFPHELPKTNFL